MTASTCAHPKKKIVKVEQDAGKCLYQCKLCLGVWTEHPTAKKPTGGQ